MVSRVFHLLAVVYVGVVGCSVPNGDLVADRTVVLLERAPRGVHLQAGVLEEDGELVVRGTVHSEHAHEVVGGHLQVSAVEPDGETFCDVKVSIREERLLAPQMPKRGTFVIRIPGIPQRGTTVLVEYHPPGM